MEGLINCWLIDILLSGITTKQLEFTGEMTERPRLIRRNTWTKLEGDLTTETTSRSEFKGFQQVTKTESVQRRQDNLTVGGTFHVSSRSDQIRRPSNPERSGGQALIRQCYYNTIERKD